MRILAVLSSFGLAALLATGCASSTPGAQPEDMSAEQHRAEAEAHEAEAKAHEAQFDPGASQVKGGPIRPNWGRVGNTSVDWRTYNPTGQHLTHAAQHKGHAEDHRAAAAALEKSELELCAPVPVPIRAVCPLESQIKEVAVISEGVRLTIDAGVQPAALLAHARCHAAVGASLGRDGMDGCPLYLKGLEMDLTEDGSALEIRASDAAVRAALQGRARALLEH